MPSEAIIEALRKRANELSDSYMRNVGNPARQLVGGGVRGYFGLDAPEYADALGMDAYRNAAAFSNVPGVGAPAGAVKAMAAAPLLAKALRAAPRDEALETARKNAVKMLGLPENNTAMDRAQALGFVNDVYHGTKSDIKNIDPKKSRIANSFFTSEDPRFASSPAYAGYEGQGGNVMPLLVRNNNQKTVDAFSSNPMVESGALLEAKDAGFQSIKVLSDGRVIVIDPSIVRSRFAAFDPAKANKNDLLGAADPKLLAALAAGTTTAATVSALRNKREEEKKKKRDDE